jgi:hypothetical protein
MNIVGCIMLNALPPPVLLTVIPVVEFPVVALKSALSAASA